MSEPEMKVTQGSTKNTASAGKKSTGFTAEEKAAMKDRARELKAEERASKNKADGEAEALAKIAELPEPDRSMAQRLHEIILEAAPTLSPKTWYGMPAYTKDGKIICFFQSSQKFNTRYATLGFNDPAHLDDGAMWPTAYALMELNAAAEERIRALIRKAVS
jgi:hypothetical protein